METHFENLEPANNTNTCIYVLSDEDIAPMPYKIAMDPRLLRKKIDAVNALGVSAERRNIGIYSMVIDSRLIAPEHGGSESLGVKNSGHPGAGKSNALTATLKLYPENAYHVIASGSQKSFYSMGDGLKHKAVIFTEALSLEARGKKDTEMAYALRNLLSEGLLTYQRAKKDGGDWVTETVHVEGPISLVTTTIRGALEQQLDDRMLTIHPDESHSQTSRIIMQKAFTAAGMSEPLDEGILNAWQYFHDSLDAKDVIIPYAPQIASFLKGTKLPLAARRSFARVLSAIKAITLLYQAQREERGGRLIADYADYTMAYQLIVDPFQESLRSRGEPSDERTKMIEHNGMITHKELANLCGVSGAALSQWLSPRIKTGELAWCDADGEVFKDTNALTTAKHKGLAFICCVNGARLPSPDELTGDSRWAKGGEYYSVYDLHLDAIGPVVDYPENRVLMLPQECDMPCRSAGHQEGYFLN